MNVFNNRKKGIQSTTSPRRSKAGYDGSRWGYYSMSNKMWLKKKLYYPVDSFYVKLDVDIIFVISNLIQIPFQWY